MSAKTHHDKTGLVKRSNSFSHYPSQHTYPALALIHTYTHPTLCVENFAICNLSMKCMFECVRGCVTWGWMFLTLTLTPNYCYSPHRCLQQHGLINLFTHHPQLRESQTGANIRSLCVLHVCSVHLYVYFGFCCWLCDVVVVSVCVRKQNGIDCLSHTLYIPWMKWIDTVNLLKWNGHHS